MKKNSLTPRFDPIPYEIRQVKGTQIIAERDGKITKRNSSFFKRFYPTMSKPSTTKPIPPNSHPKPPPQHIKPFPSSTSWKVNLRPTPDEIVENILTPISQNSFTHEPEDELDEEDDYASLSSQDNQSSHDDDDDNAYEDPSEDPNTSLNEDHHENETPTTSSETTADQRPQRIRKKPSHLEDYATDFDSD